MITRPGYHHAKPIDATVYGDFLDGLIDRDDDTAKVTAARDAVIRCLPLLALAPHGAVKHLIRRRIDPLWQLEADIGAEAMDAIRAATHVRADRVALDLFDAKTSAELLRSTGGAIGAGRIAECVAEHFTYGPIDEPYL